MGVFQWASGCVFSPLFLVVSVATGEFFGGKYTYTAIHRGLFEGDSLSPLTAVLCVVLLSMALEGTHGTGIAARLIAFCSWIWNCSKKRHANESRDLEGHRHGMYFSENVVHFAQKEANETKRMKLLNGDAMEEIDEKGYICLALGR